MKTRPAKRSNARRRFGRAVLAAGIALSGLVPRFATAQDASTEWGWPQPYEQVSPQSVQWLKDKGWWPLQVAFQAPWSGQNTVNIVMDRKGLLTARGIEAKWTAFPSGPAINEVLISGRYQVGNGGNFPFTSLLDRRVPVKAIAIVSPNLLHALVVAKDAKLEDIKGLKGSRPPATIGLVTGSSAEFYFQQAMKINGLVAGEDVILKNMPPSEQIALPRGITGVVSWDPTPELIVGERNSGRIIDTIYPYNMYEGQFYVRDEIIENAPDVVQALSDALVEATLWTRLKPDEAAAVMAEDPNLRHYSKAILRQQIDAYNNLYKPTYLYPHADFWGFVNEPIFDWLYSQKRITRPLKAADFAQAVDDRFMRTSFEKLGWAVPPQPVFLPEGWAGDPAKPPYPDYVHPQNTEQAQPFPEAGDLTKSWSFAGRVHQP